MNDDNEVKPIYTVENKEIFQLYEKMYFHEIDAREKINSRLQLPLALIISLIGVLGFFIQNFHHHQCSYFEIAFWVLFVASAFMLGRAIFFFSKAWINNSYFLLPTLRNTEDYRISLVDTYKEYDKGEEWIKNAFSQYLIDSYINHASNNADCNDRRSNNLNRTSSTLIITALTLLLTALFFYFGEINKPAPLSNQKNCIFSIQLTGENNG